MDAAEKISEEKAILASKSDESTSAESKEEDKDKKARDHSAEEDDKSEWKDEGKEQTKRDEKDKKSKPGAGKYEPPTVVNAKGEKVILPGPNKKCYCGSGERYKNCCMAADQKRTREAEEKEADKQKKEIVKTMNALYI